MAEKEIEIQLPYWVGKARFAKISQTFDRFGRGTYSKEIIFEVSEGAIILKDIKFETEPDCLMMWCRGGNPEVASFSALISESITERGIESFKGIVLLENESLNLYFTNNSYQKVPLTLVFDYWETTKERGEEIRKLKRI